MYSKPIVWFSIILVFVVSVLPDVVLKVVQDLGQERRLNKLRVAEETRIKEFNKEMETDFNYSFRTINVYYLSSAPINSTGVNNQNQNGVKTKAYRAKLNYDTGEIDVETKLDRPNERIRNFLSASRVIPKTSLSGSNLIKRTRTISSRIMTGLFSESAPSSSANLPNETTTNNDENENSIIDDRLI